VLRNPLITTYLKVRQNCRRSTLSTQILSCIDVMTLRAKKQMELALRVPLLSKLALGRKTPREAPTYHQFRGDFAGPNTEVKPFENQMNTEHGTSAISLHGFYEIEARRLRGFLNVKEKENSVGGRTRG